MAEHINDPKVLNKAQSEVQGEHTRHANWFGAILWLELGSEPAAQLETGLDKKEYIIPGMAMGGNHSWPTKSHISLSFKSRKLFTGGTSAPYKADDCDVRKTAG